MVAETAARGSPYSLSDSGSKHSTDILLLYFPSLSVSLSPHLGSGGSSLLGGLLLVYFTLDQDLVLCLKMPKKTKKTRKSVAGKRSRKT